MIFILDNKETMVGVLNNSTPLSCPYYDDTHTENLETGVNTYEFTVPGNHETAELIETEGYIIFTDLDGRQQMFQIKNIAETAGEAYEKTIYCEHVAIPELLACPFRPYEFKGESLQDAVGIALQGTGWELGEYDWSGIVDLKVEDYTNVLEVLFLIAESFDAEIQYEVVLKNGKITKRIVHMRERLGRNTRKLFKYGKDLKEVSRTYNSEGIVTALIGVGKGGTDGERITLAGYNPATDTQFGPDGGLPTGFEKPLSADWLGSTTALQTYGKDGRHKFGVHIDESATTQSGLFESTLAALQVRMKPLALYEMKIATLTRAIGSEEYTSSSVRLGDTIIADDDTLRPRFLLEARIIELKRSYTQPENDECTLGDYRPIKITTTASIQKIQNLISAKEEMWANIPYVISVTSSSGNAFKNGNGSTTLTCNVERDNKAVDADGKLFTYHWTKYDMDGNLVKNWGGTTDYKEGKSITIQASEIEHKAKFVPTVYIP